MRRTALVVLGMHRSGTSALTRALNLAGAFLPGNLLPPVPGENDDGFWESARLVEADERALAAADVTWDSPARIHPEWFAGEQAEAAIADMARVLEEDFAGHDLVVIKDPRLCRLAPLAREALRRCRIEAAFILLLRHPAAVAASLAARDVMPRGHAHRLWLRYLLDAERATRDAPRVIIGFDELMTDGSATLARARAALGVPLAGGPGVDEKLAGFLDPALVHHDDPAQPLPSALVGAAWAALRDLQANGESQAARDTLDRIARMLDEAETMLAASSVRGEERGVRGEGGTPSHLTPHPSPAQPSPSHLTPHPSPAQPSAVTPLDGFLRRWLASGFFDPDHYLARNPGVAGSVAWHYLRHGRAEGRSPNPLFDPRHYARAAGIEHLPRSRWFAHFLEEGESRGINPHPLVDLRRLAQGYGMESPARGLFARFARDPEPPCNPHPLFDVRYYLRRYPDVAARKVNPLAHYLVHGATEERQPSPWFDARYYRARLRDPLPRGANALLHYVETGAALGISPTPRFDPAFFALCHPAAARDGADRLSACLDLHHGRVPDEFAAWDGVPARPPLPDPGKQAYWLRRQMARDLFNLPGFWTSRVPRIGFAARTGDFHAALELARALRREFQCTTVFPEMDGDGGCDASGLDALIVASDGCRPDRLRNRAPGLLVIGWARDRVEPWADRPTGQQCDAYWAATAEAADVLSRRLARPVEVVPAGEGAARQAGLSLRRLGSEQLRFAIKTGAARESAGEWRAAAGLQRALARLGHGARVDCREEWDRPQTQGDDAVIVPHGVSGYSPAPHQISLAWDASQLEDASDERFSAAAQSLLAEAQEQDRQRMGLAGEE